MKVEVCLLKLGMFWVYCDYINSFNATVNRILDSAKLKTCNLANIYWITYVYILCITLLKLWCNVSMGCFLLWKAILYSTYTNNPGGGNGNPLWYSWLENPMDRRAWHATVMMLQRVAHSCGTEYAHMHIHTYMKWYKSDIYRNE